MTTAVHRVKAPKVPGARVGAAAAWLRALVAWHAGLAVAAAGTGLALLAGAGPGSGLARTIMLIAGFVLAAANTAAVPLLRGRRHGGRSLSLGINYLGFLACTLLLLHINRVFVGVDALAANMAGGLPFLTVAFLGYLATGFRDSADRPGPLRRPGRVLMLVGAAAFLVAVGIFPGLATFAARTARPVPLGLLAGAVAFGLFCRFGWRDEVARTFTTTERQSETLNGLLFVSPNVLGFVAFFAGPLVFSLFVSLNEWDAFGEKVFIGLGNYARVLSLDVATLSAGQGAGDVLNQGYGELTRVGSVVIGARDRLFWTSIGNILKFSVLAIPLAVVPALFLATLLNSKAPGIKFFRAVYFVPSVAGVVAVALIWRQLFDATVGFLNFFLLQATNAYNALPLPDVAAAQPRWLSDSNIALYSLVIVFAWQYVGLNTVLFLAGLQGVPADLYEAAHLDGANRWQRFRNITLPMLKPTTFFVVATTGILALQLFSENVLLFGRTTPIGAGPSNSTLTPVVYLYEQGFRRFAQGYASAVAWVLFLLIFAFTFVQFQRQRAELEG